MATFRTVLEAAGGNNVGIVVPEETVLSFGRGKRVPVVVTIDGGYTYKTTIGVMGGRYLVSFNAETRKRTGRGAGDEVEVVLDPHADHPSKDPVELERRAWRLIDTRRLALFAWDAG